MEQNARPGFTNRMLGRWVDLVVVSFASSLSFFGQKAILLGNPVRPEFYQLPKKLREDKLTLLAFGGSQGSKFLNDCLIESLSYLQEIKDSLVIYHQTGERDWQRISQAYQENGFTQVVTAAYFHPMTDYFARADLIICRAGATTCAELIASRKPAILVPFARAADNHQEYNARELEKAGGAEVILEKDFQPQRFAERIKYFLTHKEALDRMEANLNKLQQENATEKIARLCLEKMQQFRGRF
jgi:UDP-N-acetylglucosamine--N-acetylmuramyl-(pentapeptide) pyrophosphoryl-undecaprenol N-acetylglucosamine transferase